MSRRRDSEEMFYELSSRMPGSSPGTGAGKGRKPTKTAQSHASGPAPAQARAAASGRSKAVRSAPAATKPAVSSFNKQPVKKPGSLFGVASESDARRRIDEEEKRVQLRIAELQAKAIREKRAKEKRDQFKNFIPPPEYRYQAMIAAPVPGRRNRREMEEERNTHALRFLGLFLVVCALLWWLLRSTAS